MIAQNMKRWLSCVLALVVAVAMMSLTVFAAGADQEPTAEELLAQQGIQINETALAKVQKKLDAILVRYLGTTKATAKPTWVTVPSIMA